MDCLANLRICVEGLTQQPEHLKHQIRALEAHSRRVECRLHWGRGMACGVIMLLGALGIALGGVTRAHADVIECGDVLGPGGRFELEHDLECPGMRAVTVLDGAILDLKGHIVPWRGQLYCPHRYRRPAPKRRGADSFTRRYHPGRQRRAYCAERDDHGGGW
jgi:hypothetical protein